MKKTLATFIFVLISLTISAQKTKTITLKKGQIFDVLPLKFNKEARPESVAKYLRKSVLPRAVALGYIPFPTINVAKNTSVQSNYIPDVLVFGGWKDKKTLDNAMKQLESEFSDFHPLRREIWTSFFNTHYELKEDIHFQFSPNKFYVATAYWKQEASNLNSLLIKTKNNVKTFGGKIILELSDGYSPYGYYYNPDYFYITEWESKDDFMKFMNKHQSEEKQSLKHINQFDLKVN